MEPKDKFRIFVKSLTSQASILLGIAALTSVIGASVVFVAWAMFLMFKPDGVLGGSFCLLVGILISYILIYSTLHAIDKVKEAEREEDHY